MPSKRTSKSRVPVVGLPDLPVTFVKTKLLITDPDKARMNKDELARAFELDLAQAKGEVLWWKFEAIRFRLGDNSYYTPDFVIVRADGSMLIDEVKGHLREAARVRFKDAADRYPWAVWRMIRRKGTAWEVMYQFPK